MARAHGAAAQQQGGATTASGARFMHDVDSLNFFWMQSCLNFVYLALAVLLPVAFLGECDRLRIHVTNISF